jgi:hypothetical protein
MGSMLRHNIDPSPLFFRGLQKMTKEYAPFLFLQCKERGGHGTSGLLFSNELYVWRSGNGWTYRL